MRHMGLFGIILSILMLAGCAHSPKFRANNYSSNETWQNSVFQKPYSWTEPGPSFSPMANATNLNIPVADFTDIVIQGDAQIALVGGLANAVEVYGTVNNTQKVSVEVKQGRLYVKSPKHSPVLVRITVWHLFSLNNVGNAQIDGKNIQSNRLHLTNQGSGSIYLIGDIRVEDILNTGAGSITILGANSTNLKILERGSGNIIIDGRIHVQHIEHYGRGRIHISGATSDGLCISNMSNGILTIQGLVNVKSISAGKNSQTFITCVRSRKLDVTLCDSAVLGLSGSAHTLDVDASDQSCFLGATLQSNIAYAQAREKAHVNVAADGRIFAAATDQSSIYYYGSAKVLSDYPISEGRVFAMHRQPIRACGIE